MPDPARTASPLGTAVRAVRTVGGLSIGRSRKEVYQDRDRQGWRESDPGLCRLYFELCTMEAMVETSAAGCCIAYLNNEIPTARRKPQLSIASFLDRQPVQPLSASFMLVKEPLAQGVLFSSSFSRQLPCSALLGSAWGLDGCACMRRAVLATTTLSRAPERASRCCHCRFSRAPTSVHHALVPSTWAFSTGSFPTTTIPSADDR